MIQNTKRFLSLWLMLVWLGIAASAQQALITPLSVTMTPEHQSVYSNLMAKPTTLRVEAVSINFSALEDNSIRLNLFPEFDIVVPRVDIGYTGVEAKTWIGTFPSRLGTATFVWFEEDRVQGHISSLDGNFELFGLGGGVYLIAEHDNSKFGGCGSDGHQAQDPNRDPAPEVIQYSNDMGEVAPPSAPGMQRSVVNDECFIRMIIGYTPQAKTNTQSTYGRTMNVHVALAVVDANVSYFNSNVEQRVEMAHLYAATQNQTSSSVNDVNNLRNTADGLWDEIHAKRDFYDGDMCAMITAGSYSGLCGRAYGFDYTDATNMFNVSEYDCIVGNYTMDHEFGHNRGCRHDNDGTTTPFSYGHGYSFGGSPSFRTIMAVSSSITRVNYWSNPSITFGGNPMGTSGFANNRLALNVGDFTVARHRLTPATFSTGIIVGSDEQLNMVTTSTLTATNLIQSGGVFVLKSRSQVRLAPGFRALAGSTGRVRIEANCPGVSYSREEDILADMPTQGNIEDPFSGTLFPNPTDRQTMLQFILPEAGDVTVTLFDLRGRQVAAIEANRWMDAGQHSLSVDVSTLSAGNYLLMVMNSDNRYAYPLTVAR